MTDLLSKVLVRCALVALLFTLTAATCEWIVWMGLNIRDYKVCHK
jgi:hypothetical protein